MVKKGTGISLQLRVFLVKHPGSHGELNLRSSGWVAVEHNQLVVSGHSRGNFSIQAVDGADQVSQASVLGQSVQERP